MAKIYGINGIVTGKLGSQVFAVKNGTQVVRQYQPVVFNPSTVAQVGARAKLKMMSQLAAVMAPAIAIRKQGSVSKRNLFLQLNYGLASYANNEANINLESIQLTKSVLGMPAIAASRGTGNTVNLSVTGGITGVDRVIYAIFIKQPDLKLRYYRTEVVTTPGSSNLYEKEIPLSQTIEYVIYGYAMRDNTQQAKAIFGSIEVLAGEEFVKLATSSRLTEADVSFTETRAVTLPISQ